MSVRTSSDQLYSGGRLVERRRKKRKRLTIAYGLLLLVLLGAGLFGLTRSSVRISHVSIYGGDQTLADVALHAMQGNYLFVVPHDSTFFLPESKIRSSLLTAHPDIAAVSMFRNGFTGLTIKVDYRVPLARWCGMPLASTSPTHTPSGEVTTASDNNCYLFDANGFLYGTSIVESQTASTTTATSTGSVQATPEAMLAPYEVFDALTSESHPIIGNTVADAARLPSIFDFARQIRTLGAVVHTIVIRKDEVDFFITNGPRITYLIGNEQNAANALFSARGDADPSSSSIDYIDLRFPGKVYVKRIPSEE